MPEHGFGVRSEIEDSDAFQFRIHDGVLYFRDARDEDVSEAKLDGTPAKFIGLGIPTEIVWSYVPENERRIVGHALENGKQRNTEAFELSPYGKSIKTSQPGSSDQFEAVYVKQEQTALEKQLCRGIIGRNAADINAAQFDFSRIITGFSKSIRLICALGRLGHIQLNRSVPRSGGAINRQCT